MSSHARRPSPATLIALVALVAALAGTANALPGSHQIDKDDLKGGSVSGAAIQQGATPDVISSDIHVFSGNTPGMPYLTWVMSKFLNMGFTLEQVVTMATINPARVINRSPKLGTLQNGAPGDVTILDVVEGPVRFVDTRKNERDGKVHLRPVQAVVGGGAVRRPDHRPVPGP